jgi:5-methylcytosine-specific restriction endonuclease McrA
MTHPLDQQATEIVQRYRRNENELISVLQQIESQLIFRKLGYNSMHEYCVERLKLSDSRAYELINVSRTCTKAPQIKAAIEAGVVSVSAVKRIGRVVTQENADLWIEQASTLRQKDLERAVAAVDPKQTVKEMVKPVAEDRSMLVVGISSKLEKKLQRVRELVAQSSAKPCNLEQALEQMAAIFLERKDPVQRAERIMRKQMARQNRAKSTSLSNVARPSNVSQPVQKVAHGVARPTRLPIPAAIRHQVMLRDRGECQGKTPQGTRCGCRQWTDIHHIRPVSLGGANEVDNLVTLCSGHHRQIHGGEWDPGKTKQSNRLFSSRR